MGFSFKSSLTGAGTCVSLLRRLTLAVGLISIVSTVVGTITDPRGMNAQGGGVTPDELRFFHTQLVKVGAVYKV